MVQLSVLISNLKRPGVKKCAVPQEGHCIKRSEIQGGGQEMAVMIG